MTYQELIDAINNSTKDQWKYFPGGDKDIYTFTEDLNVRIEVGTAQGSYSESWATSHPDPNAERANYNLFYGCSLVEWFLMVAVDGHRATLPAPESPANLVISRLQYKIAEISDLHGTLDEYLRRSGITVEDA